MYAKTTLLCGARAEKISIASNSPSIPATECATALNIVNLNNEKVLGATVMATMSVPSRTLNTTQHRTMPVQVSNVNCRIQNTLAFKINVPRHVRYSIRSWTWTCHQ